ncbi:DUF6318 family protein [Cellulosimicrobium funkei]|uniref:DUF6318 family protein n=2 Tax=Cellulosimicrobium TaxID=157920 RepID=UPI0037017226
MQRLDLAVGARRRRAGRRSRRAWAARARPGGRGGGARRGAAGRARGARGLRGENGGHSTGPLVRGCRSRPARHPSYGWAASRSIGSGGASFVREWAGAGTGVGQRSPSRARRATRTCGAVTWWTPRDASSTGRDGRFRVARRFARFVAFARCRPVRAAPPGSRAGGLVSRTRHAPVGGRPAGTVGSARALRSRSSARRRTLALGVVVTAGCLVAGCTGGGEPAPSPPVETSAEASVTETPEPEPTTTGPPKPERPAAMERDDAEGAAAAAEYFLELYPYVMATGDTADWEAMSHSQCDTCSDFLEQARTISLRDDVFSGGTVAATVDEPGRYVRDEATGLQPLDLTFEQEPISIVDRDGAEVFSTSMESDTRRVEMGTLDGEWIVVTIGEIPS